MFATKTVNLWFFFDTHNGRATSLNDIQDMIKNHDATIAEACGPNSSPMVIRYSDTQEFTLVHKFRNDLRAALIKEKNNYVKFAKADKISIELSNAKLKEIDEKLKSIDLLTPHLLGLFHGTMGAIRGWSKSHADLILRSLMDWAGLSDAFESVTACAYGYYKMAIDIFNCVNEAWLIESIAAYDKVHASSSINVVTTSEKIEWLVEHSTTFKVYNLACNVELSKVLNLSDAAHMEGLPAYHSVMGASKDVLGLFATGQNYNLLHAGIINTIECSIKTPEIIAAIAYNCTCKLQSTGQSDYPDKVMESQAILPTKELMADQSVSTFLQKQQLVNSYWGVTKNLQQNCNCALRCLVMKKEKPSR